MTTNTVLEVDRAEPGGTRLVEAELGPPADGEVRFRVDRFALTANNVTYAVMGDVLRYWGFFPTGDPAWGRVPAMGWADVVESTHPDVAVGGRYFGWFPMAQYHDVTVSPTADGLRDDGAHRAEHASVYRSYLETSRDPLYAADADDIGGAEDRHALLRGLFLTAFLAVELFADEAYFGAESVVVLSASSKTAIGFAQRASARDVAVVGVTSPGNREFVESLPWYDRVVSYEEVATLPVAPTVSVDMAGNGAALAALHAHLGDRLAYSMIVGKSHHDAPMAEIAGPTQPQFFFAPTEVTRRLEQWGRDGFQQRSADALESFVGASHDWLTVNRTVGPAAAESAWHEAFDGLVRPDTGVVVSVHP